MKQSVEARRRRTKLKPILIFAGSLLVVVMLLSLENLLKHSINTLIVVDAEVSFVEKYFKWMRTKKNYSVELGKRSSDVAFSGNYSVKLTKSNKYGMTIKLTNIHPGDSIEISVARYAPGGHGFLVVQGDWQFYEKNGRPSSKLGKGWELISTSFRTPTYIKNPQLTIYVWMPYEDPAYFDNLKIRIFSSEHVADLELLQASDIPVINLMISKDNMKFLSDLRARAYERGILSANEKVWVKGKLESDEGIIPIKLRFKGDWLDHMDGKKWSFRIKARKQTAWNKMVTFSIQKPLVRNYISEWIWHRLLDKEDLLGTRYEFILVKLNGRLLGTYVYEEHFDKHLPELNGRREGPIVKFNEDAFWDVKTVNIELDTYRPIYESSEIDAFKQNRINNSEVLSQQFEIAKNLMHEYKYGLKPFSEIFDLDKTAKYFAIMDLTKAFHGLRWHNQRFYFNPITMRLEPIGFDGYAAKGVMDWIHRPFMGYRQNETIKRLTGEGIIIDHFFADRKFVERYIFYLQKFSNKKFVSTFIARLEPQIKGLEELIQVEYPDYKYDRNFLTKNAKTIRDELMPFDLAAIKVYLQKQENNKSYFKVYNYHCLPVVLIGSGETKEQMDHKLAESKFLPTYSEKIPPEFEDLVAEGNPSYLFFTIPGMDTTFHCQVIPWKYPEPYSPEQELFSNLELQSNDYYQVIGDKILFKKDSLTILRDILIPEGYIVLFEPGVKLNFIAGAKFISKSTLNMMGTMDDPIHIYSSDSSANGFTVLEAEEKSVLNYVVFDHLNTLNYRGWILTGAVTFYESEVEINNCSFTYANCEDGLNVIRSKFFMTDCFVGNSKGDGLDVDFSKGVIQHSLFINNGNDGIDFSGSYVNIKNSRIENSGEKGISCGEESKIIIESATIINCPIAVASKDYTRTIIYKIVLKDCNNGFVAYQKKPEFGPAYIKVLEYTAEGVDRLYVLEKGSILNINGSDKKGDV
ncbi:MAG: right-handed parallel beta-helix repeat-containing protein [Bacteroidetes bacterium]|nr:right-handed parallel beta-helix repeat-containing protein [Bacteroidota bacterium]